MNLFYRELGTGYPIIILHGLFGMSDNWMTVGRKLSDEYRVIIPDQRNHGNSPKSDEWNYKVMAKDLHELVQKLELESFYLVGHSMGGKVAMTYAKKYQDRIKKLIVVDITPRHYKVHHQEILDALAQVDLHKIESRKEAEEQLKQYIDNWGIRQFLLKSLSRNDDGFEWQFNLQVINDDIENVGEGIELTQVTIPTLFIGGSKSNYIDKEDAKEIRKIFTNSVVIHIKDAGHWVHAEKTDEFLESLTRFLSHSST